MEEKSPFATIGKDGNHTLFEYLNRIVTAVEIPTFQDQDQKREMFGPPPLILDGASGVGKTQQAFALLKSRGSIGYIIPQEGRNLRQDIYKNLNKYLHFGEFLGTLNTCMKELNDMTNESGEKIYGDPYSHETICTELSKPKGERPMDNLITGLVRVLLFWGSKGDNAKALDVVPGDFAGDNSDGGVSTDGDGGGGSGDDAILQYLERIPSVQQSKKLLERKILFIDEALPPHDSDDSMKQKQARDRLRFLRNTGRALKMQVIPAGTSAVDVNIIDEFSDGVDDKLFISRMDLGFSFHWTDCTFVKYDFHQDEIERLRGEIQFGDHADKLGVTEDQLFNTLIRNNRPLFVHSFLERAGTLTKRLSWVGRTLCWAKGLDKEDQGLRFTWLAGVWLKRDTLSSSSPYAVQAVNLVRGHFFEPALMVHSESSAPYITRSSGRCSTVEAPSRIQLYHISKADLHGTSDSHDRWLLKLEKEPIGNFNAAMTKEFRNVKKSLSVCTQQCLFLEPLLAIALSTQHRLSVEQFKTGIYRCIQESHAEHIETVVFAALQVANGKKIEQPNKLDDFILKLVDLLSPDVVGEYVEQVAEEVLDTFGIQERNILHFTQEASFDASQICALETNDLDRVNDDIVVAVAAKVAKANAKAKRGNNAAKRKAEELENKPARRQNTGTNSPVPSSTSLQSSVAPAPSTVSLAPPPPATATANSIEERLKEEVPWFVPAYKYPENHGDFIKLFQNEELNLAALVPQGYNSRFDISATKWPNPADPKEPTWNFEVKARTGNYSKEEAISDLTQKCEDSDKVGKYNAMLIAVCGETKTECHVWTVQEAKGGKEYLRVVLRIAGERLLME